MPEIPDTAPQPQDRKPRKPKKTAEARQAEADGYIDIEACGLTLRIPVLGKVPLKAVIAFKRGDEFAGTEELLGPEQWAAFMKTNPTVDDFAAIGEQLNDILGN